jgi:hypothetical protein
LAITALKPDYISHGMLMGSVYGSGDFWIFENPNLNSTILLLQFSTNPLPVSVVNFTNSKTKSARSAIFHIWMAQSQKTPEIRLLFWKMPSKMLSQDCEQCSKLTPYKFRPSKIKQNQPKPMASIVLPPFFQSPSHSSWTVT